jgi:hypothetical protein
LDSCAVDKGGSSTLFSTLYQHPSNDHLYFKGTNDYFRVSSVLTPGAWHHIALSWEGDTASALLYIDGVQYLVNVQGDSQSIPSLDEFEIGHSSSSFPGAVDEVRIWSRVLAPEEIRGSIDASAGMTTQLADLSPGDVSLRGIVISVRDDQYSTEQRTVEVVP